MKKRIARITIFLMIIAMPLIAMPQRADAATPTVKIGGVSISSYNDGKWHAYNAKKPTISGWTAGKYKLSADGKTLYLNGFKYSGSKRGIYSSAALKVVASGTNTFTCNGARGICLGSDDEGLKNLTLAGASSGVLTLKCTDAKSICVNTCTMSSGTVNGTGKLYCEANYTQSGGKMAVTGGAEICGNASVTGGTLTASGAADIYGTYKTTAGTVSTGGNLFVSSTATISGGTVTSKDFDCDALTLSGGTLTSKGSISVNNGFTGSGGTATASKQIYVGGNMSLTGAAVTASTEGVYIGGNLTASKGTLTGKTTADDKIGVDVAGNSTVSGTAKVISSAGNSNSFRTQGTLTVNGGTVEVTNSAVPNSEARACTNLYANEIKVTGGTIIAKANGTGGDAIHSGKNITITGGKVTAEASNSQNTWPAFRADENIYVSGGTVNAGNSGSGAAGIYTEKDLTVSGTANINAQSNSRNGIYSAGSMSVSDTAKVYSLSNSSQGIYTWGFLNVSGSADVNGAGNTYAGVYANQGINITGGRLTGTSANSSGVYTGGILTSKGGEVNGTSVDSYGVWVHDLTLEEGSIYGESSEDSGVHVFSNLKMTGGKLSGKTEADWCGAITCWTNDDGNIDIADDIWVSAPDKGYLEISSWWLDIYDSEGNQAKEATLQKVSSISVKSGPDAEMFEGDALDADGLELNVVFEDGSTSTLPYNYNTRDRFTFDISEDESLDAGTHTLGIDCLTKKTSTDFTVRKFGSPVITGSTTYNSTTIRWDPVDGVSRYYVYARAAGESDYALLGTVWSFRIAFNDTGLSPGTTKDYYVVAERDTTSRTTLTRSSNVLTLTTDLRAPVIEAGEITYDSITIEWEPVEGATDYEVYRLDENNKPKQIGTSKGCKFKDAELITGKEYSYYVRSAVESIGLCSENSNLLKAVPVFEGKTKLNVTNASTCRELSWDAVDGATSYEIWRGDGEKGAAKMISSTDETSYKDTDADCYKTYNYTVKPLRMVGDTEYSAAESNVVISAAQKKPDPESPKGEEASNSSFSLLQARAAKVTKKSVKLSWKKVPGARKYIVYGNRCGKKYRYKKLRSTTQTAMSLTKVLGKKIRKGTYYKFTVVALDKNNNKIATSKTIHVATKGGKVGNDKKVTTNAGKKTITLRKGKTYKLKAKAIPASKKLKVCRHRKVAYESGKPRVAAISGKGVIKGKSKGTCYVYAYAQNGVYAKVKVIVK